MFHTVFQFYTNDDSLQMDLGTQTSRTFQHNHDALRNFSDFPLCVGHFFYSIYKLSSKKIHTIPVFSEKDHQISPDLLARKCLDSAITLSSKNLTQQQAYRTRKPVIVISPSLNLRLFQIHQVYILLFTVNVCIFIQSIY